MKNKFKLPHTLKLSIFLFLLCFICSGLLALVNALTEERIKENTIAAELKANQVIMDSLASKDSYENVTLATEEYSTYFETGVKQCYKSTLSGDTVYTFKVESTTQYGITFNTLVSIKDTNSVYTIIKVEVLNAATSYGPSFDNKFYDDEAHDFNMNGKVANAQSVSEFNKAFVSGATISGGYIKDALSYSVKTLERIVAGE